MPFYEPHCSVYFFAAPLQHPEPVYMSNAPKHLVKRAQALLVSLLSCVYQLLVSTVLSDTQLKAQAFHASQVVQAFACEPASRPSCRHQCWHRTGHDLRATGKQEMAC